MDTNYFDATSDAPFQVLAYDQRRELELLQHLTDTDQYDSNDSFMKIMADGLYQNGVLHTIGGKILVVFMHIDDNKSMFMKNHKLTLVDLKRLIDKKYIVELTINNNILGTEIQELVQKEVDRIEG